MNQMQVSEAPRHPTQGISLHFVDRVPARCRPETTDRLPATPTIDFCRASYMEVWAFLEFLYAIRYVADNPAAHPELGILNEAAEAAFKVVGLER